MQRFLVWGAAHGAGVARLEEQDLRDAFERRAQARLLAWAIGDRSVRLELAADDEPPVWEGIGYLWAATAFRWEVTRLAPDAGTPGRVAGIGCRHFDI